MKKFTDAFGSYGDFINIRLIPLGTLGQTPSRVKPFLVNDDSMHRMTKAGK